MSSGSNVELVRSIYHAFNGGRMPLDQLDPQIELDLSERIFNPAVYNGHDGAMQFWAEIQEIWESWVSEPERLLDAGDRWSHWCARAGAAGRAASRWRTRRRTSGRSATAR